MIMADIILSTLFTLIHLNAHKSMRRVLGKTLILQTWLEALFGTP